MIANNSLYTWREHRPKTTLYSQIPMFIDCKTTKVPTYSFHTSLYGFTEDQAKLQMKIGNTKNRPVMHYSSELVIDTDNQQVAEDVWNKLCEEDYVFELWKLNNYKFFVQRAEQDKPSEIMVYQDRQFVTELIGRKEGLDLGIYSHPFHLIRARNAVHEVTKAKSVLVETNKGSRMVSTNNVELKVFEKPMRNSFDPNLSDWQQFKLAIEFANGSGVNKHTSVWQLGRDLRKVVDITVAMDIVKVYCKSMDYCEEKAERALKQAYES